MILVLDASVLGEILLMTPTGRAAQWHLNNGAPELHMPQLAVLETMSILRGWLHSGQATIHQAEQALQALTDFPATHWPDDTLCSRVWQLRDNATVYDATYVALAETLGATLLTADRRLARGLKGIAACPIVTVPGPT